jgi:hypothetical protein
MKKAYQTDVLLGQLAIDYLTLVSPQIGAAIQMFRMLTYGVELPWIGDPHSSAHPYSSCGPISIGPIPRQKAERGRIISVHGSVAHDVAHVLQEMIPPSHVSRIDLQVTIPLDWEVEMDGMYHILTNPDQFPWKQQGKAPYVQLIRNNEGGETLYIGKRTSDLLTRIYRKTILGVDCLRWELELKGKLARGLVERGGLTDPHARATVARAVLAGYPTAMQHALDGFAAVLDGGDEKAKRFRAETGEDGTLAWWANTVIPALKKAMKGRLREDIMGLLRAEGYELANYADYGRMKLRASENPGVRPQWDENL